MSRGGWSNGVTPIARAGARCSRATSPQPCEAHVPVHRDTGRPGKSWARAAGRLGLAGAR